MADGQGSRYYQEIEAADLASTAVGTSAHVGLLDLLDATADWLDRQILVGLLIGHKQLVIAANLGISQSTVSRRIKNLIERSK